jgi:ribonucleoside-diphosphate reductase alpha chain
MLAAQMAAPNSPQWFNTGLHWAYGIDGPPQGHYYVDPHTNELARSTSAYERPAPHACFIQQVSDDLVNEGGIMDLWVREARIFKYGSGTGSNFSALRGEGEPLSGGGKSSGLMSFLKIGDRAAGAIKSGGTTRRAAKMVVLDLDHPDIEEFVNRKVTEEQKVADLVAGSRLMNRHLNAILKSVHTHPNAAERFNPQRNPNLRKGVLDARAALIPENYIARVIQLAKQGFTHIDIDEYDTDWNSKAYYTVSGQNSNNSVRIDNAYMQAVLDDGLWHLIWRTEKEKSRNESRVPRPKKSLRARDLWEQIPFNEKLEAVEDKFWAGELLKKGYVVARSEAMYMHTRRRRLVEAVRIMNRERLEVFRTTGYRWPIPAPSLVKLCKAIVLSAPRAALPVESA